MHLLTEAVQTEARRVKDALAKKLTVALLKEALEARGDPRDGTCRSPAAGAQVL